MDEDRTDREQAWRNFGLGVPGRGMREAFQGDVIEQRYRDDLYPDAEFTRYQAASPFELFVKDLLRNPEELYRNVYEFYRQNGTQPEGKPVYVSDEPAKDFEEEEKKPVWDREMELFQNRAKQIREATE